MDASHRTKLNMFLLILRSLASSRLFISRLRKKKKKHLLAVVQINARRQTNRSRLNATREESTRNFSKRNSRCWIFHPANDGSPRVRVSTEERVAAEQSFTARSNICFYGFRVTLPLASRSRRSFLRGEVAKEISQRPFPGLSCRVTLTSCHSASLVAVFAGGSTTLPVSLSSFRGANVPAARSLSER